MTRGIIALSLKINWQSQLMIGLHLLLKQQLNSNIQLERMSCWEVMLATLLSWSLSLINTWYPILNLNLKRLCRHISLHYIANQFSHQRSSWLCISKEWFNNCHHIPSNIMIQFHLRKRLTCFRLTKNTEHLRLSKFFSQRPQSNNGALPSLCSSGPQPKVERLEQRSGAVPTCCKGYN